MPINEDQARRTISDFCEEFPGLALLSIIYATKQEDFYGNTASIEAVGTIKGAFLPKAGELHLPLANFHNTRDLRKSLQHEALGHYATLTFTEIEKRDLLKAIIAARQSSSLQEAWAKVEKTYQGQSDMLKAEEVFCLVAEKIDGASKKTSAELERIWQEVVQNKVRLLQREDLQAIVEFVADGLRNSTRHQQIFPVNDRSQF